MTAATLGHNGPPADQWVDYRHALMVAIRDDASLPPRARLLGIVVCTYMDQDGTGARPSARLLASVTGYGVNTISKIMDLVEQAGWMHVNKGVRGSRTTYATAQSYEDAIATYVKGARGRYANKVTLDGGAVSPSESDTYDASDTSCGDTHSQVSLHGGDSRCDTPKSVTVAPPKVSLNCGEVSPNCGEVSPPESDRRIEDKKNKKDISPHTPLGGASDDLSRAFEHPSYSEGIDIDVDGGVRLINGTRAYWLKLFDGDDLALDLATKEAAGSIQPNSKKPIKPQIERVLAKIARETRDRGKWYAKAASKNSKARTARDVDVLAITREMTVED